MNISPEDNSFPGRFLSFGTPDTLLEMGVFKAALSSYSSCNNTWKRLQKDYINRCRECQDRKQNLSGFQSFRFWATYDTPMNVPPPCGDLFRRCLRNADRRPASYSGRLRPLHTASVYFGMFGNQLLLFPPLSSLLYHHYQWSGNGTLKTPPSTVMYIACKDLLPIRFPLTQLCSEPGSYTK